MHFAANQVPRHNGEKKSTECGENEKIHSNFSPEISPVPKLKQIIRQRANSIAAVRENYLR